MANRFMGVSLLLITVSALKLNLHTRYDPVWFASVQQFESVYVYNRTNIAMPYFTKIDVEFRLFTRKNPFDYQIIELDNSTTLQTSNFNLKRPIKILTHGWYNNGSSPMPMNLKDAQRHAYDATPTSSDSDCDFANNYQPNCLTIDSFSMSDIFYGFGKMKTKKSAGPDYIPACMLKRLQAYLIASDLNIFVVDWDYAANVNYVWASYNVAEVGHKLTAFLNFLIREGVSMNDVHMVGHSLGAHVVGIAGAFVEKGPIHTITGLDPALPLFTEGNKDARLDRHDARFVEVIHTCAGYLGFAAPIGHVDFYPNGGKSQPGCGTDYRGFCAHNRAHRFFSESILSDTPFVAIRCESYESIEEGCCKPTGETLNMGGFHVNFGEEGVYYLTTNSEPPFAKKVKRKRPKKY